VVDFCGNAGTSCGVEALGFVGETVLTGGTAGFGNGAGTNSGIGFTFKDACTECDCGCGCGAECGGG